MKNDKTRVRRIPKRGHYDFETIARILDAEFVCQVGFVHNGHPVVIPTIYGRKDKNLYFHGATTSRMLMEMDKGVEVSLNVTLVDGIVLARSSFHHSLNYRSVVVFGKAELIRDPVEKERALEAVSEQIIPGRWTEVRPIKEKELKATSVLRLPLEEASAKIRTGGPGDEPEDYDLDIWAGVLPIRKKYGEPIPDPDRKKDESVPASVINLLEKDR